MGASIGVAILVRRFGGQISSLPTNSQEAGTYVAASSPSPRLWVDLDRICGATRKEPAGKAGSQHQARPPGDSAHAALLKAFLQDFWKTRILSIARLQVLRSAVTLRASVASVNPFAKNHAALFPWSCVSQACSSIYTTSLDMVPS